MAEKINLTARRVAALPNPEKGFSLTYDDKVPGLAVLVTSAGTKTYYRCGRVDGKPKRIKIGRVDQISLPEARQKCQEINSDVALGKYKKKSMGDIRTLGELFHWYLEFHSKPHKETWKRDESRFENHLSKFQNKKIGDITTTFVKELHTKLGTEIGKYGANHVHELLRGMFSQAVQEGKCDSNPTRTTKRFSCDSRERYLLPEEVPAFFEVLSTFRLDFQHFIRLLIFTGARRGNVQSMRWADLQLGIDAPVWSIPTKEFKTRKAIVIPLIEPAQEILNWRKARKKTEWVFPSNASKTGHYSDPKTGWSRLIKDAGIEDLRIHDLRRTLGSWQAIQGTSLHIIGKSLGHTSLASTSIYARLSTDPVRESVSNAVGAILLASEKKPKQAESF